ncbi:T-cell-specific guanine nucleotide triphosphate-binding protein 2-like [Clupea harengus]|uniref:T-cell-specific guanine nucleotide triphosphate-binding protein 2-like n=1 Tax=Clupea harengus TaxID=7950 RepID=A0A8M1K8E5_CLUHA|nr:T-cell-specific guanine nucleotide triphosphate-binding protein 2-like [Clupea harengus]
MLYDEKANLESEIKADQQDALLKDSGEQTWEQTIAKAREVIDRLDHVTLNIAVTGVSGAGKSSLVNAIRGLQEHEGGAAPVGTTQCTMEPTMYPHPLMPNVNIWDLPGIGTIKFKAETYMNKVNFQNYDFFIIIIADQQDALLKDSGEQTWEQVTAKAREVVDRLDHVTLNIAVTGETGAGKSSFINAIRGLQEHEEGAAPTVETTMESTMYPHPTMPYVKIWDLPGFKAKTFLNDFKYQHYDFFIIVSASRFTENDINLAKEIKKNKKNFYFVRTKTDKDVANGKRKNVGEEATLEKIRKACLENLSTLGSPPVFLISSHYLERFDFQKLVNKLVEDLPDHKRNAMIMSLPVYSKQSLDEKYSEFKKYAWALAFTSGAIAAIPVPGLATVSDVALVASFLTKCYYAFGLDDGSLQKLSDRVNKPILKEVKKSGLVREIAISTSFAMSMVTRILSAVVTESLCILVPGAGSIAAAAASVVTTRSLLLEGVDEMYRVAKIVLEMAEIQ